MVRPPTTNNAKMGLFCAIYDYMQYPPQERAASGLPDTRTGAPGNCSGLQDVRPGPPDAWSGRPGGDPGEWDGPRPGQKPTKK